MELSNVTGVDSFYFLHLLFVAICKVLTLIQSVHPHKPAGPVTFSRKSLFENVPCSWSHNVSGLPISSSCFRHMTQWKKYKKQIIYKSQITADNMFILLSSHLWQIVFWGCPCRNVISVINKSTILLATVYDHCVVCMFTVCPWILSNLQKSLNTTINIPEGVTPAQLQIQGRKSHEPRS
jgi:hypothetical protein